MLHLINLLDEQLSGSDHSYFWTFWVNYLEDLWIANFLY
jgi:hypothetical protein